MQLTVHTDYALRVLLYLAHFPEKRSGTEEISTAYGISKNHLVRVVQTLADAGFVRVIVGRSGGVELARNPADIRLGEVVRASEASFRLVECHDHASNTCPIVPVCGLKSLLDSALESFLAELDKHTLADMVRPRSREAFIRLAGLQ
jgi:Rrf2 family transcriptional regulator, nitric oxide-sensitive transcriptional repressor